MIDKAIAVAIFHFEYVLQKLINWVGFVSELLIREVSSHLFGDEILSVIGSSKRT